MKAVLFNALVDVNTWALLLPSTKPSILVLLNEWEGNTIHFPNVNYPHYNTGRFYSRLRPGEYVRWTWDKGNRYFYKTRKELITDELKKKSDLLTAKHEVLSQVIFQLNVARYPVRSGLDFQETVYMTKKLEALRFKESEYNEAKIIQYPYVLQYAEYANLSPREAADDILLKASFDDQSLARTELLRLKFFNKIKEARDQEALKGIMPEFYRECFTNAHV